MATEKSPASTAELLELVRSQGARIAELERQFGSAAKIAKAPPQAEDEGVRIVTGEALREYNKFVPRVVLPTDAELQRLGEIADQAYPILVPKYRPDSEEQDRADFGRQFQYAFNWLAEAPRKRRLDTKYGVNWWCDSVSQWAAEFGVSIGVGRMAFARAVVCHADIGFRDFVPNWPHDLDFGIALGNGDFYYTQAWRQMLASGTAPRPSEAWVSRGGVGP